MNEFIKFYQAGEAWMHPITACSIIGFGLALERFLYLRSASSIKKDEVLTRIKKYILQGSIDKAIAVTAQTRSPITNIIRSGLVAVKNQGGTEEVQTAMDAVALREVPNIEKRIGLLATISNIATLLGLLGTVMGLIEAFAAVAELPPAEKAEALTGAIAKAMNTTAWGLVVAIPLLGIFGWLNTMAQQIIGDMHESCVATLNFVLSNREKFRQ